LCVPKTSSGDDFVFWQVKFPVPALKFPVPAKKFPVMLRKEFGCKRLNLLTNWASKSQIKAGIDEIPGIMAQMPQAA